MGGLTDEELQMAVQLLKNMPLRHRAARERYNEMDRLGMRPQPERALDTVENPPPALFDYRQQGGNAGVTQPPAPPSSFAPPTMGPGAVDPQLAMLARLLGKGI